MKKLMIIMPLVLMTILLVSNTNYAQEYYSDTETDYDTFDIDEVKERASSGITDLSIDDFGVKEYEEETITTQGDVISYDVTEYRTAELLEQNTFSNNSTSDTYALHSISEFANNKTESTVDGSSTIRAFSTIYIEVTQEVNPDGEYWRLISSEGGWELIDPGVNTTNLSVEQGTSGIGRDELAVSESIQYTPTSIASYNYNAPVWPPVLGDLGVVNTLVGENTQVDIFRGDPNNSWVLNHTNYWGQ